MIQRIITLLVVLLVFQSCNLGTSKTWKNNDIDSSKRKEIKVLNNKLVKSIIDKDIVVFKSLLSDKLLADDATDIEELFNQVSNFYTSNNYRVVDEYNVLNSKTGINNTLVSGTDGNGYTINYLALNKEMYVSLIIPKGQGDELSILIIYGKDDNQWKINIIQFGQYSVYNKNAQELYELAKESYSKSYLIDALKYVSFSGQCLKPANNFFQYQNEKEINDFYEKLRKEVDTKFSFPITLETIDTKPKIIGINYEVFDIGITPLVYYLSDINLKDTVELKIENEKIKKEVSSLFMGIDKGKKNVLYRAYNKMPEENKTIEHFGFVDDLTK